MKQLCWIASIVLLQTSCLYGMMRNAEDEIDRAAKKIKLGSCAEQATASSGRSSAMEICNPTNRREHALPLSIEFSEADMREIVATLEELWHQQRKSEQNMSPQGVDRCYKLALIRAIGDNSPPSGD